MDPKVLVVALLLAGGCGQGQGQGQDQGQGVDCHEVFTSAGPWPAACVYEVPNGSTVMETDAGIVVTQDGGVIAIIPPCPCPHDR
jgi:hypothetical protein